MKVLKAIALAKLKTWKFHIKLSQNGNLKDSAENEMKVIPTLFEGERGKTRKNIITESHYRLMIIEFHYSRVRVWEGQARNPIIKKLFSLSSRFHPGK